MLSIQKASEKSGQPDVGHFFLSPDAYLTINEDIK